MGDRLVATAPSQVASQWEAPRPAKKRHDCLPVTAQQQQQRYADEESDRRRSTNWWSTVLSDADIRNGGEVDQVERAISNLENKVIDFEKETINEAKAVEKKIEMEIGIKKN